MAVRNIIIYGHPILRMKAKPIEVIDDRVRELAEDMMETMQQADGIGLAGNQVAEPIAVCVVNSGLIEEGTTPKAYVNPVILEDEGIATMEEGCLSIPDIREDVTRPEKIKVRYQDLSGREHVEEFNDMLARVLQHEIDHLNGVLFVDRISPIKRKLMSKKLRKLAAGNKADSKVTT